MTADGSPAQGKLCPDCEQVIAGSGAHHCLGYAADGSPAVGEREALELRLLDLLDDDDAVSAVQVMVEADWRPPGEVAALVAERDALREEAKRANDGEIHWGRECERLAADRDALQAERDLSDAALDSLEVILCGDLQDRSRDELDEAAIKLVAERDSARREREQAVKGLREEAKHHCRNAQGPDAGPACPTMWAHKGATRLKWYCVPCFARAALIELGESTP